jgi:hypothetical protein
VGKTVSIPVDPPIVGHKGKITEIVVREPTFDEYLAFGDPYVYLPLKEGSWFRSDNTEVLAAYVGILVVEPKDKLLLGQGGFKLAREIKDAVLSFFLPAAEAKEG